jgi:hypothetical protein
MRGTGSAAGIEMFNAETPTIESVELDVTDQEAVHSGKKVIPSRFLSAA